MKKPKSAREKLEREHPHPEVENTPKGKMLIPTPLGIDALVRQVRRGKLVTVNQLRERLARDFQADYTCPLTTGIFLRIAAEAAEEDLSQGKKEITPYWRVVKADGSLNEKFPGGGEAQAVRLREEGYTIEPGKGKKPPRVKDWGSFLQRLFDLPQQFSG